MTPSRPGRTARAATARAVTVLALAAGISSPGGTLSGQSTNPVVAATLEPDSIHVGGVFALDLWVDLPTRGEVRFPAVLPLPEDIEQREAVDIESNDDGKSWRARYKLSAWSTDSLSIPAVVAGVVPETGEEFTVSITAPLVVVASILPADEADLALRDARPFLRVRAFPWWVLLILAVIAAAAYWFWRRRGRTEMVFAPSGPGHVALRDLERLRGEWVDGGLSTGQFYDRYEHALRRYARATRRWAPSRSLVNLGVGGDLLSVLRRSMFIRFAHLRAQQGAPEAAIDAGEDFIRSEMPDDDDSEDGPS